MCNSLLHNCLVRPGLRERLHYFRFRGESPASPGKPALGQSDDDFEAEMRFLLAAKLYELGRVTSGRAADIAGVDRVDFIEKLSLRRF